MLLQQIDQTIKTTLNSLLDKSEPIKNDKDDLVTVIQPKSDRCEDIVAFSPTKQQILLVQHFDFRSIPSRRFLLPSQSYLNHELNYPNARLSTYFSYRIKWMLNSDGWMMLHDLKGWMKVHFLKGWLKCLLLFVEFMFHSVIGSMMLHDLTGWLKESVISILFFGFFFQQQQLVWLILRLLGHLRFEFAQNHCAPWATFLCFCIIPMTFCSLQSWFLGWPSIELWGGVSIYVE